MTQTNQKFLAYHRQDTVHTLTDSITGECFSFKEINLQESTTGASVGYEGLLSEITCKDGNIIKICEYPLVPRKDEEGEQL